MFLSLVDGGQRQIAKAQYGQTKPGLSLTNIREFQIPIPPISEQDRFIEIWTRYEDLAARTIRVSSESDGLFNSLVQQAFRGEL
jgi:type I restriction enzyme S subunit